MADPVGELLLGRVRTIEYSSGNVIVDAPRGCHDSQTLARTATPYYHQARWLFTSFNVNLD